jgi:hypothetical protein
LSLIGAGKKFPAVHDDERSFRLCGIRREMNEGAITDATAGGTRQEWSRRL